MRSTGSPGRVSKRATSNLEIMAPATETFGQILRQGGTYGYKERIALIPQPPTAQDLQIPPTVPDTGFEFPSRKRIRFRCQDAEIGSGEPPLGQVKKNRSPVAGGCLCEGPHGCIRQDKVVFNWSLGGEAAGDLLMGFPHPAAEFCRCIAVATPCSADEAHVLQGNRTRHTVEETDVGVAHRQGFGCSIGKNDVGLGGDIADLAVVPSPGKPVFQIGADQSGAGVFGPNLGHLGDNGTRHPDFS